MSDETGLISVEMAAALLMISPAQLAALSRRGIIAAVTKNPIGQSGWMSSWLYPFDHGLDQRRRRGGMARLLLALRANRQS